MISNIQELHEHVLTCYPMEAVGIVKDTIFYPKNNTHPEPVNNFSLSKEDSLEVSLAKASVIHSHTYVRFNDDPRTPTYEDMQGRERTQTPWGIVHTDGKTVSDILWFGGINTGDLIGRYYISNVFDCFTLARDFLYITYGIDVGIHPRPGNWQDWNPYYIERTWSKLNFSSVNGNLQYGDIVLFTIGTNYINHIGVYIGDDRFIHHLYQRNSIIDSFSKWNKQFKKAIRYNYGE